MEVCVCVWFTCSYVNVGWIAIEENVTPCLPSSSLFLWKQKIIPVFTRASHRFLSCARWTPSIYFNTMLLFITSSLYTLWFPNQNLYTFFLPCVSSVSCPYHIWRNHYSILEERFKLYFSSLRNFPRAMLLFFRGPIYFFCSLFWNVLYVYFSLALRNHDSQLCITLCKICLWIYLPDTCHFTKAAFTGHSVSSETFHMAQWPGSRRQLRGACESSLQ
jgi:hypothetical protein